MFDFLSSKFSSIFTSLRGQKTLTEANISTALASVHDALIEADVPYDVVQVFIEEIKSEVIGKKVIAKLDPAQQLLKIVHDKIVNFLGGNPQQETTFSFDIPSTIMVMGLQGSGKTTTVARLAYAIKQNAAKRGKNRKILVASVDFYRPAAIAQLELMAQKSGVDCYQSASKNPIEAVQDIVRYSQKNGYELLILDTAGRLHIDASMLDELKNINAILKPKYKLLVLDAMTGQESLAVAQAFFDAVGFMGAILTKMDSATRAGCAFAFRYALKKPILYVGIGERVEDLELFRPERVANTMLDMGDILTLVEKAQEKIEQVEQKKLSKAFDSGMLSLQDFADQLAMVSKLGSLSSLVKYLPGVGSLSLSPEAIEKGETELKKFKAIISSMTVKEKLIPKIINASRKQRIAKGSGVTIGDVDILLTKFEQSQQFVKIFKKMGKAPFA